ncbi:MAG: glycosyltransferase family 1 protein [Parcubacteria group bacterium]|jgi:glycosyltransferase involved in cell wall biosynthesis
MKTIGINASFIRKPNTGIGQVTINFLRKLIELKVQSEKLKVILYLEEDLPKNFKLPDNFECRVFLPIWKRDDLIRKIWWEKCLLPRQVKKDNCDVFFSVYQCPTAIENIKHIMLVHDIIPKLFPEYLNNFRKKHYQKLTEKAIRSADKILAVSRRTEKDLIQHLGVEPEKITVNYIDIDEIYKNKPDEKKIAKVLKKYSAYGGRLKPGYILAGGGLEVRKNVEGVIRAYDYLYKRNKQEHFIGEMPKLVVYGKLLPQLAPLVTDGEKLARELNLTKQIRFLDMTPQDDMPAIFSESLMFVYPSHYEGFGMPPLEAMNIGVPTIISKSSSLPEVGGDGALYCKDDDIHDIAMVMRNVLLNKNLRETLKVRAKMQAQKFSWDKFVEKFLNIIENV